MQLDELKKSMTVLDQVLAKTGSEIEIDVKTSRKAKSWLLRLYLADAIICLIVGLVFLSLITFDIYAPLLPGYIRIYVATFSITAALWYGFLYLKLRSMDVATLSPSEVISRTNRVKFLTLTGEIVFAIAIAVLFTMLFPFLLRHDVFAFRQMIVFLCIAFGWFLLSLLPKIIRSFRELNAIKD